jgi:hypothetical protein
MRCLVWVRYWGTSPTHPFVRPCLCPHSDTDWSDHESNLGICLEEVTVV